MAKKNNILFFDSEEEAVRALEREGKKLEKIARKIWRMYESSYTPKHYVNGTGIRTGKSMESVRLGRVKKHADDTLSIELTFRDGLAYHNSVFKGGKKGHSIMLISEGWKVKKGKHKDVYRFGYYEGFNYIEKVKSAYEASKNSKVELEVQWAGGKFKKKKKQANVLK